MMRLTYSDPVNLFAVTFSLPLATGYILRELLPFHSSVPCIMVMAIVMGMQRVSAPLKIEQMLIRFWNIVGYVTNVLIFMLLSIRFGRYYIYSTSWNIYYYILMMYILSIIFRFLSFLVFAPVLSRIGYGITWKEMAVIVWACLKSPISLCLTIGWTSYVSDAQYRVITNYIFFIILLTLVVNGSTTNLLMRGLGLIQVSPVKQLNMNNCMKYILVKRNQSIAILKMDRYVCIYIISLL